MAFKLLHLEVLSEYANKNLSARIRRHDGKLYDPKTKKFQSANYFGNAFSSGVPASGAPSPLIPLTPGSGLDQWIATAAVAVDPKEFTDGDYSVYYHDATYTYPNQHPRLFDGTQVSIFNGDPATQKVPSTTDTAIRIMDARVGTDSVRNTLLKAQADTKKLDEILAWVKKQSVPASG